ncbi:MAG: LCP family protein [Anaerolineae bacterium]|nr:LCP family protein [Anaerolineae bacterium]
MADTKEIETHLTALFSEVEVATATDGERPVTIQDLKQSSGAHRKARRQKAVFQSLVENAIDAIFISDLKGNQTYSNRACYDLFGYDRAHQEMEKLPLASLWPEGGERTLVKRILRRAKAGGWSGETQLARKDGARFDAYLTAFPVEGDGDHPTHMALTIRDISALKALEHEERYRSRAQHVQLVAEMSQEIAAATNLDELYRRVVHVVKERLDYWCVQLFCHDPGLSALILVETSGRTEEEARDVGRKLADARGCVVAAAASGQPMLIPDVRASSQWIPYPDLPDVRGELAVPIKSRGQVLGVLDVLSDTINALTREDEILLIDLASQVANAMQSAHLLEKANILHQFADAPEGIGWITLEEGLVIYANAALCSILGEDRPEDTFGKSILSYYPADLKQRVQNEILPAAVQAGQWNGELSFVSAWGKVIPTMQSIFLVRDDGGKPLYLVNVVTDVSAQKQAESIAGRRARQIGCLNDVGRKIEAEPPVPEFLQWVAERIPQAMQAPDVCVVAVEFEGVGDGDRVIYGDAEAIGLPCQIVEDLTACGEVVGRLVVAYAQERELPDEDRALVGDVARRASNYIESRCLLEQVQAELEEVRSAHQVYKPGHWAKRVPEPTPLEETAHPKKVVSVDGGLRARLQKGRAYKVLQKLLRRVSIRLFVLVPVSLFLVGMLLTTGVGFRVRGEQPAATLVTVTKSGRGFVLSPSPSPTSTPDLTHIPSPTRTLSGASFPLFSPTLFPTSLPTPLPTSPPTSQFTDLVTPSPFPEIEPTVTSTLPIPPPVQPVPVASDAVNIVVLGSDRRPDWSEWHTDAVHVVSVQRDRGVVSVISIPRDLYLYIPGFWMSRINFADFYGETYSYEGGGPALVRDTLLYNLGIRVDYYARTNFDGLIGIVDTLGGVDIPVHCQISDYWPYADENGEYPTLELAPGIQHMDGETALWYARTRMTTSVFSRERRQQQVLQALWHKMRGEVTLAHIPSLWEQGHDIVQTDLDIASVLDLSRVALALEDQNVRYYSIGADEVTPWTTPRGGRVFLPQWEAIQPILAEAMAPMPEGRLRYTYMPVEVWNGTYNQDWDWLAADRLHRAGFSASVGESDRRNHTQTQLFLFKESVKGSGIDYLKQLFGLSDSQVIHQPGGSTEFGYRLIVGADYQTCPNP